MRYLGPHATLAASPSDRLFDELKPFALPDEQNTYCLGAHLELKRMWADAVYLFKIKTPLKLRKKGLASFALDDLVGLADRHGVQLVLDCGSLDSKNGLTTKQLRDFYARRDFVPSGGFEMRRMPR
jgi:hypothetical protein